MNMKLTNQHLFALLAIWGLSLGLFNTGMAAEPISKPLTDFSDASVAKQWISVNDNVMGGISEGAFRISEDNTLVFSGNLSLENRGGFTSIRTRPADLDLDGYERIALRLKGDGRSYYFNLMNSSRRTASSYRAPIKTKKGSWQEVRINLKDFVYTSFGRIVAGAGPIKADDIQSMGITLADKKAGPFSLEVSWIRAEKGRSTNDATTPVSKDIVDTAVAAGKFNTLVAAVKAAGLVDSLKSKGPLTVFAPTDEAFAKLPEGTVEDLLKPENRDKLIAVLSYHVVSGKIMLGAQSPETLQGQSISIKTPCSVEVNGANVLTSDVEASNGVIHIIDTVLLPPAEKLTSEEAAKEVIELAIKRGVPLFNAGQPSACAAIYEVAVESLLKSHNEALNAEARSTLRKALSRVRDGNEDSHQQAWTLRRSLDAVYKSLAKG
jgi:uncharacterized surface protein with fasciclin (FAS1) repeats